jgi:hypothetical protein
MSGLEISIGERSSTGLRLPPPRKSFFVENLRARLEPPEEGAVSGVGKGYDKQG